MTAPVQPDNKGNVMTAKKKAGFTLIELMITVVVIGILAAIAYPSYVDSVRKSRRADAKTAIMDNAQRMETFYAREAKYTNATLSDNKSPDGFYSLALTAGANTYTITATPVGDQANDAIKGFRINEAGKRESKTGGAWVNGWSDP